jgi:KRAB domain-containing zinc finger protein
MEIQSYEIAQLPPAIFFETVIKETHWKCEHCRSFFDSRKSLNLHLGKDEKIVECIENPYIKTVSPVFLCRYCRKKFDTDQGLQQHIGKKHEQRKPSTCEYCNKTFKHKYAVKFHINQVHTKTTRVLCKYCQNSFYNTYVMKQHSKKCKFRFPRNPKSSELPSQDSYN